MRKVKNNNFNKSSTIARQELRFSYIGLSPILLYMVMFVFVPIFIAFVYSFMNTQTGLFVGFQNYYEFFFEDPRGLKSLKNTFMYALIRIPPTLFLGFFIAVGLNKISKGRAVLLFGFFAPVIVNMIAFSSVFMYLYSSNGLFNALLKGLGFSPQAFLSSSTHALTSIALMDAWKHLGFDVVIYLAALQGIPNTFYEAARIDGASRWQVLTRITLPLMQQTILYLLVVLLIWTMQVFEPIFAMTGGGQYGGGPLNSTRSIMFTAFQAGFRFAKLGYANAISFILFITIFIITLVQLKLGKNQWSY